MTPGRFKELGGELNGAGRLFESLIVRPASLAWSGYDKCGRGRRGRSGISIRPVMIFRVHIG